jgi:hypothetical protein
VETADRIRRLLAAADEAAVRVLAAAAAERGRAAGPATEARRGGWREGTPETRHDPERRVRERAYFLWKREGRPEGRAEEFWVRASREEARAA